MPMPKDLKKLGHLDNLVDKLSLRDLKWFAERIQEKIAEHEKPETDSQTD